MTDPRQARGRGGAPVWSPGWAGLTLAASDSCTSSSTDNARQDRLSKEPRRRRPPHGVAIAARPSSPHSSETPPRSAPDWARAPAPAPPQVLPPRPSRHGSRGVNYEKRPPRKRFPVRRARGCAVLVQPGLRSAGALKRALSGGQPRLWGWPSHPFSGSPSQSESGVVFGTLGTNLPPARVRDAIPGTVSVSCLCRCGLRSGLPACLLRGSGCLGPTCQEPDHSGGAGLGQVGLGKEWSWRKYRRSSLFCRDSRRWGMAALQSYSGAAGPQSQGEALTHECGSSSAGNLGDGAVSLKYFSVSGDGGGRRAVVVGRIRGSSHIHYGFAE